MFYNQLYKYWKFTNFAKSVCCYGKHQPIKKQKVWTKKIEFLDFYFLETCAECNKDDLGRISSGFMMFWGQKLEWEEEKYLQGAQNLWEAKKSELGTRQPI